MELIKRRWTISADMNPKSKESGIGINLNCFMPFGVKTNTKADGIMLTPNDIN